jgi:hypothetical protein
MAFTARTETYADSAATTSLAVSVPESTTDGDILFLLICTQNGAGYGPNSGLAAWTPIASQTSRADDYYLYYRIASSEPASYTIGFSGSSKVRMVMSCYTSGDFNGASPIDVYSNTAYATSNTTVRAAAMTVAAASSPMVFWAAIYGSAKTFTKPSNIGADAWTEDEDSSNANSTFSTEVCSMIRSASGDTAAMNATASAGSTTKHAFAVALKPPVVSITPPVGSVTSSGVASRNDRGIHTPTEVNP